MLCKFVPRFLLAAATLLLMAPVQFQPPHRIAVLGALPPATDAGAATAARDALGKLGYRASLLTGEELSDAATLGPQRYELLVVPHSETFPAAAQANLLSYLKAGGKLLCLGGPPFRRYVFAVNGQWRTWDEVLTALPTTGPIVDVGKNDVANWARGTNDRTSAATLSVEPGPHGPALHFDFKNFTEWDNFSPPPFTASPYPAGSDLMVFWAKGDAKTDAVVVEWKERDRSRWIASVGLTPEWKRYVLAPRDFRYWKDNPSQGRGGAGDQFHPDQAAQLAIGLAQSHATMNAGPKNIWISDLAAAHMPPNMPDVEPPVLEALSPWYKLQNSRALDWRPIERYRGVTAVPAPGRLKYWPVLGVSSAPEPMPPGARGTWVYRALTGTYSGAAWGAALDGVVHPAQVAELLRPWYVASGGPSRASVTAGATVEFTANLRSAAADGTAPSPVTAELRAWRVGDLTTLMYGRPVIAAENLAGHEQKTVTLIWSQRLAAGDTQWSLLFKDQRGAVVDSVQNRFTVLPQALRRESFVSVRDGEFIVAGRTWRPAGINFWPLWVSGQDRDEYFSSWLAPNQYDAQLIEENLDLARSLGINCVSMQYNNVNQAPALQDFLARCLAHGIRANVYVSGGHPLQLQPDNVKKLIGAARLADNPAVFAYDVAWEPHAGHYDERKGMDPAWEQWVLSNYGSVEKAGRDWGVAAPRADAHLTSPPDSQFMQDGPWRRLSAAYRRFLDDRVSRGYRTTRDAIRAIDHNHLIGARSGSGGNGSIFAEGALAFDLRSGAAYLDFISPEGYAVSGDWPAFLGAGGLTTAYARWAGDGKPVFWAEFGRSVYPQTSAEKLASQGQYYDQFYRMALASGANGWAGWWWPGGLRLDENSDYGVIGPDMVPRPSAVATKKYAPKLSTMVLPLPGRRVPIVVDRDADARGYAGILMANRDKYAALRTQGAAPVIETPGTATTTANMPLLAVGNVPADGANPLKYANADLSIVSVQQQPSGLNVVVTATNTGDAAWTPTGPGRVALIARVNGEVRQTSPVGAAVRRYGSASLGPITIPMPSGQVTMRLAVVGRRADNGPDVLEFGEKAVVPSKLVP